ncbi:hypothetical protein E3T55_03330 [Cryobacterium frigoriphilum]|uniref:Uncharacterized protein n=1 Tax=Cryobacterium frigoriphilum TaxID=1259150 RepID=A0A4R9A9V2_9MICO|nr:hypothetical protein [Cryobacterium frigoriphilum]TFD54475.1 hypothetical protein E3T55_03330 [Cryobacterium frigoriphilum]
MTPRPPENDPECGRRVEPDPAVARHRIEADADDAAPWDVSRMRAAVPRELRRDPPVESG